LQKIRRTYVKQKIIYFGLVLALLVGTAHLLASPVSAGPDNPPDIRLNDWHGSDSTGGSEVYATLFKRSTDGAVYVEVQVKDAKADGKCAHATIRWGHENENVYDDNGMWVCGAGQVRSFTTGARNWTRYDNVLALAFVDNGEEAAIGEWYWFKY
jgi:hypothetical protein